MCNVEDVGVSVHPAEEHTILKSPVDSTSIQIVNADEANRLAGIVHLVNTFVSECKKELNSGLLLKLMNLSDSQDRGKM